MNPIRCVIIDDEPLARKGLTDYVARIDFLQLEATGSNPVELSHLLEKKTVDLVFLDVQMPVMNGIDYLRVQSNRPMVILTTAYPQYALESYQLDVLDYLVKPITFERFHKAVVKARDYHHLFTIAKSGTAAGTSADYFFIRSDYRQEKIFYKDVLFMEALQNYVSIHTKDKKYLTLLSLKQLEQTLPADQFIRVHKSFIVSISKTDSVESGIIHMGDVQIPVGRAYKEEALKKIIAGMLLKKK